MPLKTIKIFCEGVTDQVFIADCLELFFEIATKRNYDKKTKKWEILFNEVSEIVEVKGCDNLKEKIYIDKMIDNSEIGGINLVVFDADKPGNGNNGRENAIKKLEAIQEEATFNFFLWPNDTSNGEIEDLLRKLVPSDKELIFKCFENQVECLENTSIENLKLPTIKEQLNFYLYTVNQEPGERNRDYKNKSFWNLDFEQNEDLKKFKIFLEPYFQTPNNIKQTI